MKPTLSLRKCKLLISALLISSVVLYSKAPILSQNIYAIYTWIPNYSELSAQEQLEKTNQMASWHFSVVPMSISLPQGVEQIKLAGVTFVELGRVLSDIPSGSHLTLVEIRQNIRCTDSIFDVSGFFNLPSDLNQTFRALISQYESRSVILVTSACESIRL